MKSIAVITGASSGLGRAYAHALVTKVEEIWAIARHEDALQALRAELGERIVPLPMDLTIRANLDVLRERLEREHPRIHYAIADAGFAKFCTYSDLSLGESLNMIDLNCGASVAAALLCLPYMDRGDYLLFVASQAAFQPLPCQNLYSATKAFVRHYARALNLELAPRGITATAVCPGWMRTHLYDRAIIGARKGTRRFPGMVSPEAVAKQSLRDAQRGRDMSVYGLRVKAEHMAAKLLPQRAMMRLFLAQQGIRL
ncbi:MAG: SDR family NAD(P)-dependent oxidoreductase [Clostridia bacterium]|nr:SDR family NAD(P)-dependent oxidoreductase [Clostridia bacterium]